MPKVLIVEDDVDVCETYTDILESAGYEVTALFDTTTAIEVLVRGRMRPDVVILDLNLRGVSGLVVLGLVRRMPRLSKTKVVIASGYPDLAQRALEEWGADIFIGKPVSVETLRTTVARYSAA